MLKENKPLSEVGRKNLYKDLEAMIEDCCPLLENRAIIFREMQDLTCSNELLNRYKLLLEVHLTVLYAIIEVAIVMRADLRSKNNAEKRENLKYLVFAIHEFYKSLFYGREGKSVWNQTKDILATLKDKSMTDQLSSIEDNIQSYKDKYFNPNSKDIRDTFVHYDDNVFKLYKAIVNVNEEELTQMVISFLAMAKPIHQLLLRVLLSCDIMELNEPMFKASVREDTFRNALKDTLTHIDSNFIHFTKSLDKIMRLCSRLELLASNKTLGLNDDTITQIKDTTDLCKLGVLIHFFYIDICVAMKGYLCAESRIESLWHLTRMYLIIYETHKKLFAREEHSLWNKLIRKPLDGATKNAKDLVMVEANMNAIMQDKVVENVRQAYVHIRQGKKFRLTNLMTFMAELDTVSILDKSLLFIKIVTKLLTLSKDAINVLQKKNL